MIKISLFLWLLIPCSYYSQKAGGKPADILHPSKTVFVMLGLAARNPAYSEGKRKVFSAQAYLSSINTRPKFLKAPSETEGAFIYAEDKGISV
ncbi:hypothetical protein [Alkalicoccus daliensis]|uniref:Uncharacterized protein n=1 Tax=Alkalicoccus daliensis TaxID=745820 RepID=A0A1H0CJF8_9BACI|nr:hypothetical protein [Alkalicoccus daliensis]SDN57970.1 hypothetical protein SAMN04488053_102124 [Alkalicoccus daliensis]